MSELLHIFNEGTGIRDTNFWRTDFDRLGLLFLSIGGGAARLLVPRSVEKELPDMVRGVRRVELSMLALGKQRPGAPSMQILLEDGSSNPYALLLSQQQIDNVILPENIGKRYEFTLWVERMGKPHRFATFPVINNIVPSLPWGVSLT